MKSGIVAVVGRPNVGKSTLFNRLIGGRLSIVEDMPGVTRDRVYGVCEWLGNEFSVIDTGGIEFQEDDGMFPLMLKQAEEAVVSADIIVFVCDAKFGLTAQDYEVADFLRKSKKPVVVAVNKIDGKARENLYDFYDLHLSEVFGISAEQGMGIGDLLDRIIELLPGAENGGQTDGLRIAIVGKPNAGKSSILNKLVGYQRVIVSPVAGTTRDAIDEQLIIGGKKYILTDTAGIRKKSAVSKTSQDVEYYSIVRAFSAIERSDVCALIVDCQEGLTEQDVRLAGFIHEKGKPSVNIMNKWDLIEKDTHTVNKFNAKLKEDLKFMDYFIPLYVSAVTGKRLTNIIQESERAYQNSKKLLKTGVLNDIIGDAIAVNEPPHKNGKKLKISYTRQVVLENDKGEKEPISPPTFEFFVNDPTIVHFSYKRFLENIIRKSFSYDGTPIRLRFVTKTIGETAK